MRHFIFFWRNNEVLGLVTSIILLITFLFLWWKNTDICTLFLLSLLLNWLMQFLHFRLAHCWYDRKAAEKTKHAVYNIPNMFLYNTSQIMNVLWTLAIQQKSLLSDLLWFELNGPTVQQSKWVQQSSRLPAVQVSHYFCKNILSFLSWSSIDACKLLSSVSPVKQQVSKCLQ